MTSEEHIVRAFISQSHRFLVSDYLPKIQRCLGVLTDEDIWWRPNEASNSIGNLMLHLAGNVGQWIVSGIGGAPDRRDRPVEFSRRLPQDKNRLFEDLSQTVDEAVRVLNRLDSNALLEYRSIQGQDVKVLDAVYHVVEHFSMHTGQIIYITKLRTGRSMHFYEFEEDGTARPTWREQGLI